MAVDGLLNIRHAAVADCNCFAIKDLMQHVGNSSSRILRKARPTLVATFLLYGGLYQMMSLWRFFLLEAEGSATLGG